MRWEDRIGRRLRLRDLHTLLTVARIGSMAKAAAHLAVSQPAISKAIADMEHTFGVRLFDRKPQGVEPTLYGHALLRRGDVVMEELRQAVKEIESLADPASGEVWVGTSGPTIDGLLPPVIDRLSLRYPRIVFHIKNMPSVDSQHEDLRTRKLDLAISRMARNLAKDDVDVELLFDEPLFVVAGARNKWVRRKQIELSELMAEAWVLPTPDAAIGAFIGEVFRASGLEFPRHGIRISQLQFSSDMVATGRYLGMFPGSFLHFHGQHAAIKILPVRLALEPPPICIATLKNRTLSPAAELFIDCVRTVVKPLAGPKKKPTAEPA